MQLRTQLIGGQALSWLLTLVIGVAVLFSINHHAAFVADQTDSAKEILNLETIQADVFKMESGVRGYDLTGDATLVNDFNRARDAFNQDIAAQYAILARDRRPGAGDQERLLNDVRTLMDRWFTEVADPEIANQRQNPDAGPQAALAAHSKEIIDPVSTNIARYLRSESANTNALARDQARALSLLQWLTVIGLLAAVLASFGTSLWLADRIAGPVDRLAQGAQRLADGALDERVERSGARELQQMADAFNEMATKLEVAQADLAERNRRLNEQTSTLERASEIERGFSGVLRLFNSTADRGAIREEVLRLLDESHGFVVSTIYRYDEWSGALHVISTRGIARDLQSRLGLHDNVVGQAVKDRRIVVLRDDPLLTINTGLDVVPARFIVIVPVYYQERIMGAMVLASLTRPDDLTMQFLDQLAQQLGVALHNIIAFEDLQTLANQLQARQIEIEEKNLALERAGKAKSEFLANMSHELRTPLNAIIGFSELLQEQFYGPLNKDQAEYLTNIRTAGEHLLSLINDILDLSKIEAGRMELDLETVNLSDVLESSVTILRERAHNNGVQLGVDAGDTGTIIADARKLKQVFFNLLSNAVKFTPSGGSVRVTARAEGEMIEIAVADTGVGITAADQEKLFQEFTQVDGSLARRHEGTGLGLALTKRLVELHGGTISVQSAPGEGSIFTVRLPAVSAESRPAPAPSSASPEFLREEPLILVVEDDDPTAKLVAAHLESAGYATARARNGEEGLQMARELAPDGITLDVMMPVMDGWTFLEYVSRDAELSRIPVIVLSVASDLKHGWSLGASAVLRKPVRRDELVAALVRVNVVPHEAKPAHILVVDDDPKAVEIISDYLAAFGHRVHKAYGGAHGIEIADDEHPDLIILDLMMPTVNGFTVVNNLRENPRTSDIPIIILTAKIIGADERQRLNGHIVAIAEKSGINRADFLSEVNRALGSRVVA